MAFFVVVTLLFFSVGVGAFVIRLSQISSFFSTSVNSYRFGSVKISVLKIDYNENYASLHKFLLSSTYLVSSFKLLCSAKVQYNNCLYDPFS